MKESLTLWGNAAAHFIFPEVCQVCSERRAGPDEGYLCADCWQNVRFVEEPFCQKCGLPFEGEINQAFECSNCKEISLKFDQARSAVHADEFLREIIHRFKYDRARFFGNFLGGLLLRKAGPELAGGGWDEIVPVPLHSRKLREREFNQAVQISGYLSESTGIPLGRNRLARVVATQTQTRLTRKQRTENVKSAFSLKREGDVEGRSFVLVDDVLTTGATTSACAQVLKKARAGRVCVWTVARATFSPQLF